MTSTSTSVDPSPHRQVPGNNFINPDGRAGLPGCHLESILKPKPARSSKPTNQASSATSHITRNPDVSPP
ncbi:hypothetical protein EW146_g5353 [Bondarzewia mesenterica]|uniref:Uncharacterized protein n=1 Tax=Bondarzewia mesenterica TaxID=1095465 RepID=A0A4S4LXI9_9AGAM|nr:hypothetical protein EW146_g5353 [Bondarzewia mesenterica]